MPMGKRVVEPLMTLSSSCIARYGHNHLAYIIPNTDIVLKNNFQGGVTETVQTRTNLDLGMHQIK